MADCVQVLVYLAGLWESWGRSPSWHAGVSHSLGAQYIFVKWMNTGEEKTLEVLCKIVKLVK